MNSIDKIIKRNGAIVPFNKDKIYEAVHKAFKASKYTEGADNSFLEGTTGSSRCTHLITNKVVEELESSEILRKIPPNVEEIQDKVEKQLMLNKFYDTAKRYIIYREERSKQHENKSSEELSKLVENCAHYFDDDPMRQFVYYRTYSRWNPELGRREIWSETVQRYMTFMQKRLGEKLNESEYRRIHQAILKQEVMPSMRLLQFAGPAAYRCNTCIYNCGFTAPENFKDIVDIMYLSMSGVGVGWSVESKHVDKLPMIQPLKVYTIELINESGFNKKQIKYNGEDISIDDFIKPKNFTLFIRDGEKHQIEHTQRLDLTKNIIINKMIVEDSKEGWCDAFHFALDKLFSGEDVEFDYSLLRPMGARLKTMGGRSSGPSALKELISFTRDLVMDNQNAKLKPINVHDLICKIGQIVVSGGTRRTAMISISDLNDSDIRDAKKGKFWTTHSHRALSNNSAVYNYKPNQVEFMREWLALAESGNGERGIFNRSSLKQLLPERRVKYLGEDIKNMGGNPCLEIFLKPKQKCNLSELIARATDNKDSLLEKMEIATIIGTYQATLIDFKYIDPQWIINQKEEALLGVSITGQWDCPILRDPELFQILKQKSIKVNIEYAKRFDVNPATAITCVKPSGSVSQLVNCSSGLHPRYAPYYIRRIRISASDPLFKMMKDQGFKYFPEVGQTFEDATTFVFDFPIKSPEGAIITKDLTAIQQLEYHKMVKINYTEHNPSFTCNVGSNEWIDVSKWIWENWDYVCGVSFLPRNDHIYDLAPYEEITKELYEELIANMPKVHFSKLIFYENEDNTDVKQSMTCTGTSCELN